MGRHVNNQDTSDFPFSYLIEQQNTTYIMPGANLKSVGTIRDAKKWPLRDNRSEYDRLDQINYNLLSPYVVQKMLNGTAILHKLQSVSGENADVYSYQGCKIKRSSLVKGLKLYSMAIDKFLGNSLISRIMKSKFDNVEELRKALIPVSAYGEGKWVDISGMIAPMGAVSALLNDIQEGVLTDVNQINERFAKIHASYYDYEWRWAYGVIEDYYKVDLKTISVDKLCELIDRWKTSVVGLDNLVYEDARKEFSLNAMTGFGADGNELVRKEDFMQVRGSFFESNPFVVSVLEHIKVKSQLGQTVLDVIRSL